MEKFTADNGFSLWRIKIDALGRHPATLADKENDFISNVYNTIYHSFLGDEVLLEVADEDTATSVWLKLESLYMTKSLTNK
ncbi:cytochrome P450, partial [Trifolium medium]|nr:cytochrome P450 [Trifolium medium]